MKWWTLRITETYEDGHVWAGLLERAAASPYDTLRRPSDLFIPLSGHGHWTKIEIEVTAIPDNQEDQTDA